MSTKSNRYILLILLWLSISILITGCSKPVSSAIELNKEVSYFDDFTYDKQGNVVLRCNIGLINKGNKRISFNMKMDVSTEKKRGFIKDDFAYVLNEDGKSYKLFTIEPKEDKQFNIPFKAKAGATKTKENRLLLPIIIFNTQEQKVILPNN